MIFTVDYKEIQYLMLCSIYEPISGPSSYNSSQNQNIIAGEVHKAMFLIWSRKGGNKFT